MKRTDADKIYIVDHGQVIAQGSAADQIRETTPTQYLTVLSQDVAAGLKSLPETVLETSQGRGIYPPP